jgi:DoxX-like protein
MKAKTAAYWISTTMIALVFLPGGIFYVLRVPPVVAGVAQLGFPAYFVTFLGVWKVLGAIALLVPGFALVKEWAYAGMFFDLTGAAVASAATGNAWWHVLAPLAIAVVLVASWALRPPAAECPFRVPSKPRGLAHESCSVASIFFTESRRTAIHPDA